MAKNPINARQKLLHTFTIDYNSEADDRRYVGEFTTKKLSIRDLSVLGVRKSQLNGGMHHDAANPGKGVDEQTDEFNSMIAHLDISLVSTPPWWNLDEMTDLGLLSAVYKEVLSFENKFLGRRAASGDEGLGAGSEGSGTTASPTADTGGSSGPVVDPEVQAALEP